MDPFLKILLPAIIGGLFGFLGACIGARITERRLTADIRMFQQEMAARLSTFEAEQKNRFKLAAMQYRLPHYQEAFTRWAELLFSINGESAATVAKDVENWWFKNNLYLDDQTRRLLSQSIFHAPHFRTYGINDPIRMTAWNVIQEAGQAIIHAVDLSFIPEQLQKEAKSSNKQLEPTILPERQN